LTELKKLKQLGKHFIYSTESEPTTYSGNMRFFVNFGEISYLVIYMKNRTDQEPGLILTGNFIEKQCD
jgi:hypothetical protein